MNMLLVKRVVAPYFCFVLALFFCLLIVFDRLREWQHARLISSPVPVSASAPELLEGRRNFRGNPDAPFTLIEFGDYQCQPCRHYKVQVDKLLSEYSRDVKFDFRNLPLPTIHPYAEASAEMAEAARRRGVFWKVHDQLYQTELSTDTLFRIQRYSGLSSVADDRLAVRRDMRLAERLGIHSTPTFILCKPDGHSLELNSLASLHEELAK